MVYLDEPELKIRSMEPEDAEALQDLFRRQGWHKTREMFEQYYQQQQGGSRHVIVAETPDGIAGYVTLLPKAPVGPYAGERIPEIVDFNVLKLYQRRGIGWKIMDVAERLASEYARSVSLSVGLHSGYGSAQRMYVRRGYLPDGSGVWYRDRQLEPYAPCANGDDLVLYFKKEI